MDVIESAYLFEQNSNQELMNQINFENNKKVEQVIKTSDFIFNQPSKAFKSTAKQLKIIIYLYTQLYEMKF